MVRRCGVRLQVTANKPSADAYPALRLVAVAVLTAPTTVSVSDTGTTTLTFTATTDQPPGGGGLWVEIFEKIMPGGFQNLGGLQLKNDTFQGACGLAPCAGHVCRHFGVRQQHVPAGRAGRELQPGDTSALGDLPGGQRDDHDEHELSLSGNKWSEIFDRTKESGETRQDR